MVFEVRGDEEGCIAADHACTVNFVNARYYIQIREKEKPENCANGTFKGSRECPGGGVSNRGIRLAIACL